MRFSSAVSCGTKAMACAQAVLGGARDVVAVDQDAAGLQRIDPLHQGGQRRLAAARRTDQPDPLPRRDVDAEAVENLAPPG